MQRNHRLTDLPAHGPRRCAPLPIAALAAALAAAALTPGFGFAQETGAGSEPAKTKPGLRVKSVIMPKAIIVDPAPEQDLPNRRAVESGDRRVDAAQSAAPRAFRIGIVSRGRTGTYLQVLDPIRAGIAKTLGRPAEILAFSNFAAMIDAQMLRRIDLGFYSTSAYAVADKACSCLEPLVAPVAADGSIAFHGIIVARRQSGIASIDDLEGREIAVGAPDSVGSRRIQMAELSTGGIDVGTYFSNVKTARSAVDAILMVRDEQADAAFVWSSLSGDAAAGYSRGALALLVGQGKLNMDEIAIIWRSRPIAHAPVAIAKSLPGDVRQALAGYFVGLFDDDPDTYDRLERDYGGGYQTVRRQDYAGAQVLTNQDVAVRQADPAMLIPRTRPQPPGDWRQAN